MSLDLNKVAAQVDGMVNRLKTGVSDRQAHLRTAIGTAKQQEGNTEALRRKIASAKTTWLVAEPVEDIAKTYPSPPVPPDFNVIAADGSHIDVDRHRAARCYLLNISGVLLRYGSAPDAVLESHPHIYIEDDELVIAPAAGEKGREQLVEGALLGMKRGVEECRRVVDMAAELPQGSLALGIVDGTLILWGLEAFPDFVADKLLTNGFLECLSRMQKLNTDRKLALASYVSYPRSTDVVNALRVAVCPYAPPNCDLHCPYGKEKECDTVSGVRDRDLFASLLGVGERSALFANQSSIVRGRYGEHCIYFFYVRMDEEIGRVEIPQWVAQDKELLDLTHSLILDQCRRGQGYPVALSEAHEQAVVTMADRENFWALVEASMEGQKLSTAGSEKNRSKKTRWV